MPLLTYEPKTGQEIYDTIIKPRYDKYKGVGRMIFGDADVMVKIKQYLLERRNREITLNSEDLFDLIKLFGVTAETDINSPNALARFKALKMLLDIYKIDFDTIIKPLMQNNQFIFDSWSVVYSTGESLPKTQQEKVKILCSQNAEEQSSKNLISFITKVTEEKEKRQLKTKFTYFPKTGYEIYYTILKPEYNKNKGFRRSIFGKADVMSDVKKYLLDSSRSDNPMTIGSKEFFNLIMLFEPEEIKNSVEGTNKARHIALIELLNAYKLNFYDHIKPLIDNQIFTAENWTLLFKYDRILPGIQKAKVTALIEACEKASSKGKTLTKEEKTKAVHNEKEEERMLLLNDPPRQTTTVSLFQKKQDEKIKLLLKKNEKQESGTVIRRKSF